jgi:hypothetical protein
MKRRQDHSEGGQANRMASHYSLVRPGLQRIDACDNTIRAQVINADPCDYEVRKTKQKLAIS